MAKVLAFSTEEGGEVLVAVRAPGERVEAVGAANTMIEKANQSLDDALRVVGRVAESVHRGLSNAPVEYSDVELHLQFSGKGTLVVVESEVQAAFTVRLRINGASRPPASVS